MKLPIALNGPIVAHEIAADSLKCAQHFALKCYLWPDMRPSFRIKNTADTLRWAQYH